MAGVLRQVFDDVIILGELENNPADGLIRLLPKPDKSKKQNFAHIIEPKQLADLLRQLDHYIAHEEQNQVKGAYNKAEYLAQRTAMMQ